MAAAPVRTATIGRRSETRRAMRAKRWVLPRVSLYMAMTLVESSSSQNCKRSLPDTSERSPSDTNHDRPMSRRWASRRSEAPSEPDCITMAMLPGDSSTGTSAASRPISRCDVATPMLDGPMMRTPWRRARATSPSTSTSGLSTPSTAVTITAPRTWAAMQSSSVGVERGGGHGDDRQPHVVGDRGDGRPDRVGPRHAITIDAADRRAVRVDRVHRHVGGAGDVAPQHGTDRVGAVRCPDDGDRAGEEQPRHRSAVGAVLALGERVEVLVGRSDREVDLDDPTLVRALQRPPGAGEDAEHRPVLGEHLGREALDAVRRGDGSEVLEQQGGDPLALVGLVDHEGGVGVVASGPALVAGPGDELAVPLDAQRRPPDHVDVGEVAQLGRREHRLGGEEAPVVALG